LIPINLFNPYKKTLFTGMALTLHKSQLQCSVVMQAVMSLQFIPSSVDSRCVTCERIVLLLLCCVQYHDNESSKVYLKLR